MVRQHEEGQEVIDGVADSLERKTAKHGELDVLECLGMGRETQEEKR